MAPLRTYMLPAFAAIAAVRAAQIEDFMPGCAPECINEAIDTHSTCEQGDGECLCADIYSLKRHAEDCLESSCSDAEYGEAMLGYDEFCSAVEDGPTDPTSSTSVPPPETTKTSAPPPPETTEEPEPTTTVSVPEEPTSVPEEPTSEPPEIPEEPTETPTMPTIEPTDSHTSISVPEPTHGGTETFPSYSPVPMPTVSVPTNGTAIPDPTSPTEPGEPGEPGEPEPTTTGGDGDGGEPPADPTVTETPPPSDSGANFGVSFGILAGGALVAAFVGF